MNPLHGVESKSSDAMTPQALPRWNPLHGVERYIDPRDVKKIEEMARNPLHGVERESPGLRRSSLSWMNPLHGVESESN